MLRWLSGKPSVQLEPVMLPVAEGTATKGSRAYAADSGHVHPRLSSAINGTLDANGEKALTFGRTFSTKPVAAFTYAEAADSPPVTFKVKSWIQDGSGNYTGCVIKGYRGQTLPASLTLLTALVSFNVFAGSAAGVEFHFIALQPG